MRALVTGAIGFVGTHVVERLLADGADVVGLDCLADNYAREQKLANLEVLLDDSRFSFVFGDLLDVPLDRLLDGVDVVVHLAARPGVRTSWAGGFADYVAANVQATQRLLEASRHASVERLVYASSSSVYGNAARYPTAESVVPQPFSPYGVTKLAGEHLVTLYGTNFGLPTVSLRYFTVYGPRQRPDMAIHRLVRCALEATPFTLYGDGTAIRDFTYVGDVADATVRAATRPVPPGSVFNVAGGSPVRIGEVIDAVEAATGRRVELHPHDQQPGDVASTGGTTDAIAEHLAWRPCVALGEGIARQVAWHRSVAAGPPRDDASSLPRLSLLS